MGRAIGMFLGGILSALLILLAVALVLRGLLDLVDRLVPDPPPPTVLVTRADFPLCVTVKPPPLLRSPDGPADKRINPNAFNDKGIT